MIIKRIKLNNYRNLKDLDIVPEAGINVFLGDNGQGKTNILESIYLCSRGRSMRHGTDKQIIMFGKDKTNITINTEGLYTNNKIDMELKANVKKKVLINGEVARQLKDLLGNLYVVSFCPEDMNLVKDSPSVRRRFLDIELCQIDKIYYFNLQNYHNILKQRNALLKEMQKKNYMKKFYSQGYGKNSNNNEIDFNSMEINLELWTEQLIHYGELIIRRRIDFINELDEIAYEVMKGLTGARDSLKIDFMPNSNIEQLKSRYLFTNGNKNIEEKELEQEANINVSCLAKENSNYCKSIKKEIMAGNTLYGPHKDDISFFVNQQEAKIFSSQGQQRSVALSIKLAQIKLLEDYIGEKPILILDDVFSELDRNRQLFLMENLKGIQSFISCTGIDDFMKEVLETYSLFKVFDGNIINE